MTRLGERVNGYVYIAQTSRIRRSGGRNAVTAFPSILGSGLVKIGFTRGNPRIRMVDLSRSTGYVINIVAMMHGSWNGEQLLLRMFHESRANSEWGSEWFYPHPELAAAVQQMPVSSCPEGWAAFGVLVRIAQ